MVYWVRFLTLHRVFLTPGGGLTGVSRRQYLDPRPSVFIRYTPVLPICRSTAADLLRTITVTFSGTIVAEFLPVPALLRRNWAILQQIALRAK
jgi:hypothetical protein